MAVNGRPLHLFAQIGVYAAFAGRGGHRGHQALSSLAVAVVAPLAVAGFIVCSWQQTRNWRDSQTLWTHAFAHTFAKPDCRQQPRVASRGRIPTRGSAMELKP